MLSTQGTCPTAFLPFLSALISATSRERIWAFKADFESWLPKRLGKGIATLGPNIFLKNSRCNPARKCRVLTTGPPGKSLSFSFKQSFITCFPGGTSSKESTCPCRKYRFDPWVWKIPWNRKWHPTPVFLPGKSHGQRSLVGYSSWGHKESDKTEQLSTILHRNEMVSKLGSEDISMNKFLHSKWSEKSHELFWQL